MIKVFKIGGNVIDNPEMLERFTAEFAAIPGPKVLVHGGGAIASKMQKELGMQPQMIGGRRVTDADTLRIVSMVGLTNKTVVALLQKNNCNALGLSGADGDVIRSHKRPPVFSEAAGEVVDYGFGPDGVAGGYGGSEGIHKYTGAQMKTYIDSVMGKINKYVKELNDELKYFK